MPAHRNRYVKIQISERCATRLQDARVVGQADDYLLLERAAPKERTGTPRKPRAKKANSQAAARHSETTVAAEA